MILRLSRRSAVPTVEAVQTARLLKPEEHSRMETNVHNARRIAPVLLSSLLATAANASIPKEMPIHAVAASAAASATAPTIVRLEPNRFGKSDPLAAAMNACVDAIKARDLDGAVPLCDRAVSIAAQERSAATTSIAFVTGRRSATAILAAGVSNRAVLRWMKSDPAYVNDLRRAQKLAPDLDFVKVNAAAIGDAPKTAASVVAR